MVVEGHLERGLWPPASLLCGAVAKPPPLQVIRTIVPISYSSGRSRGGRNSGQKKKTRERDLWPGGGIQTHKQRALRLSREPLVGGQSGLAARRLREEVLRELRFGLTRSTLSSYDTRVAASLAHLSRDLETNGHDGVAGELQQPYDFGVHHVEAPLRYEAYGTVLLARHDALQLVPQLRVRGQLVEADVAVSLRGGRMVRRPGTGIVTVAFPATVTSSGTLAAAAVVTVTVTKKKKFLSGEEEKEGVVVVEWENDAR